MSRAAIDIQVVDRMDGLIGIKDQWDEVQNACEHKHVLLDHRFVTAWWNILGDGKSMHTLVLRRDGIVEGIVPLVLSHGWEAFPTRGKNVRIAEDFQYLPSMRWRCFVPVRRLSFPLSFASSNIRSHLVLRRTDPEHAAAVMSYCHDIRGRWDMLSLDGIPMGTAQADVLTEAARRFGLRRGRARHSRTFLRATLPESMEAFLAQRSHNFRRSLRRAHRQGIDRTSGLGEFRIREFRGDTIDEGMNRLFELERLSWKARAGRDRELHLALDDRSRRFHREAARAFASSDQAQVLVTEVGGRPANALYSLERQGEIACVLTYQAEALANRVAVAPLWGRFFEIAIERGLRGVDFNGNNTYLARYADGLAEFSRLTFYNTTIYSTLLRVTADAATRLARKLPPA